jgi:ketosteroid isomerase-like protein
VDDPGNGDRVIREWAAATCNVDIHALGALFAPDAVIIDEPSNTRYIGRRGHLDYAQHWWTGPFQFRIALSDIRRQSPDVWDATFAATVTHVGTFTSRWGDAPATGNEFSLTVTHRCTVVNGRVAELRVIYNLLALLRAVGITPPRGAHR